MLNMTAKKVSEGTFEILVDGVKVAKLSDCEVCWIFETDDEELSDYIDGFDCGDMSVREHLGAFRKAYEALASNMASEADFDTENDRRAVERFEYDAEALIDLERHNALG